MKPQGKIMHSYLLPVPVVDLVVGVASKAGVSQSEIMEKIITEWSQMASVQIVEEVTEKDVFEDINKELKKIYGKLHSIERMNKIIYDELDQ